MTNVCTHAGDSSKQHRLFTPARMPDSEPRSGEGEREGEDEGERGGAGRWLFERWRRPRPASSTYGEILLERRRERRARSCSFSSSSCSTSRISSPTPSSGDMAYPSRSILA